jgi:polysaccharide biosynthesis transport protein
MRDRPTGAPHAPPMMPRDRLASRMLTGSREPTSLNGAAVIAILKRRLWPLLASTVLVPLLTWLALSQITPLYTATGTLLYDASEYKLRELQSILRTDPITDAVMTSQAEVLRGIQTVAQVASRLNLYANPEFNVALRPEAWPKRALAELHRWFAPRMPKHAVTPELAADATGPQLDPARNATLQAVRAALAVAPLKSSQVLEVSFTAQDPVLAAAAVNHAMDAYVKGQLSAKRRAVDRAREWLKGAENELRNTVRSKEDEIARYRVRNGMVEGMHARLGAEQISLLNEDLAHSRNGLAAAEGRLDAAAGRSGAAAQAAIAPAVVQLCARESQLTGQLQAMLGRLGASHPDVQSLRAQRAGLRYPTVLAQPDRGRRHKAGTGRLPAGSRLARRYHPPGQRHRHGHHPCRHGRGQCTRPAEVGQDGPPLADAAAGLRPRATRYAAGSGGDGRAHNHGPC